MKKMKKNLFLSLVFLIVTVSMQAKVTLPAVLDDNMVLQQETLIKIWGWSAPGANVKLSASWGEQATAKADEKGNWIATLKTPAASFNAQSLTISDGEPVTLNNILIGEVWLCSGQSNMEMTLLGIAGAGIQNAAQAIAESVMYPGIRLFAVSQKSAVEPQNDCTGNWSLASPATVKSFSAIGYFYAVQLQKILNVPVGIINSSWGGTAIECWMDAASQKPFSDVDLNTLYDEKVPVFNKPVCLYNAMIYPLLNFQVRGFLWYQGETNVVRPSTYAAKMVAMIGLWRTKWGNDSLPFYYAEIAPYNYAANQMDLTETQTMAALLREQQYKVMSMTDNTGMVCTNDLVYPFERNEIHPSNKQEVAIRFTFWALHNAYGYNDVPANGPQFKSMRIDGDKAALLFENEGVECAVRSEGNIEGFEIAGRDRVFYPAVASRGRGYSREVVVSSEKVPEPVAVRYCFRNFMPGNAKGVNGLPLIPFRTDAW
jgi:sialate O-acetylesterase